MPDSFTPNLNLVKPEINQSAETWGIKLNSDLDALDAFAGTLNTFVAANDAHINALIAAVIPRGVIVAWSGSIASIPAGWLLCNGANGTPNLTDRFILGNTGSRPINDAAGSFITTATSSVVGNHSHSDNTQAHSLTVEEMPAHQHGGNTDVQGNHHHDIDAWNGGTGGGTMQINGAGVNNQYGTKDAGSHSHNIVTDWRGSGLAHRHGIVQDGTHSHSVTVALVPPYYSLAYIMRA